MRQFDRQDQDRTRSESVVADADQDRRAPETRLRRILIAAMGAEELSWTYIVANQVFILITFRPLMGSVPSGLGMVGLVVVAVGEVWLTYHVIRKLRRIWRQVSQAWGTPGEETR